MLFKIVDTNTQKVICDHLNSYHEAWETLEQLTKVNGSLAKFQIEEYNNPVKRLGRDPDLH
jgi:hypothetical protein